MDVESHSLYTKFIWKIITGQIKTLNDEEIREALGCEFMELKDGILHFYTPSGSIAATAKRIPEFLQELVYELRILLGLDVVHTWNIVTNYLKHELRGSAQGLFAYLTDPIKMTRLITDMWLFHWNDRLFRHKCMNFLLTHYRHEDHEYQHIFRCVLADGRQTEVVASLVKQLKKLINIEVPTISTHGRIMTLGIQAIWLSHILYEQLEVLHNILLCIENGFLTKDLCLVLFSVIQNHTFGFDLDVYKNILNDDHEEILKQIEYMETIVIIRALQTLEKESFLRENLDPVRYFIDEIKSLSLVRSSLIYMCITAMMIAATNRDAGELEINPECFKFLQTMINHRMFKVPALYAKIAYCTVHDIIQMFASIVEAESLQQVCQLYGVATELLCHHEIIQRFFQSSSGNGLFLLFSVAMKYFPENCTFVRMVINLSACGPEYINQLLELLTNLPTYFEVLTGERALSLMYRDEHRILAQADRKPLKYTNFIIPRGTVGTLSMDNIYEVLWKCKLNFFFVLADNILGLQTKIRARPEEIRDEVLRVAASYKILTNLIKSGCTLTEEIIICLDALFPLLRRISENILNVPTELTAACLECVVALHLQYPNEVFTRLERLHLVPTLDLDLAIKEETPASIFKSLPTSVVVTAIVSKESLCGEYPLLKAYVLLLQKILREPSVEVKNINISSVFLDETSIEKHVSFLLPGVVCMLRDIFSNIFSWWFKEEEERESIIVQCLHIVHWLLGVDADTLKKNPASSVSLLHSLCIYSLLYSPSGETLLKVVTIGEPQIQAIMRKELCWWNGRSATIIHSIHLALSILNRVILAKMNMEKSRFSCALEYELYPSERSSVQVPLVVANYLYNCFNPSLRSMAVVVLIRFAQDKPKSLLSFLSLDPSLIRFMFIGPLLSNLESENLKVNIIQLITLSLQTQPALANVLLNIQHSKKKVCNPETQEVRDVEDGFLPFVYTVLQGQGRKSQYVFGAVICFLHAVWTQKCELVIEMLRHNEAFWTLFFAPVHQPKSYGWDVYKKIFYIVSLEEYGNKVSPMLLDQLRIYFATDVNVDAWFKVFEELLLDTEITENMWHEIISFFAAWEEFVLIHLARFGLEKSQKLVMYQYSMRILLKTLGDVEKHECTEQISELLTILMGNSHGDFICNNETALKELIQVLQKTLHFYNVIPIYAKSAISMFILELMQKLTDLISQDSIAASSLMDSVCRIVTKDLEHLPALIKFAAECDEDGKPKAKNKGASKLEEWQKEIKVCSLNLIILKKLLLELQSKSVFNSYMHKNKIFSILLRSTGDVLQESIFFDIAVSLMDILLILAATPFSRSMVSFPILEALALNLLPKNYKLNYAAVLTGDFKKARHWTCGRWPRVYVPALQMLTKLLCALEFLFLEDVIGFVECHIEFIVSSIISFRYTLRAELPKAAIQLVCELSKEQYGTRANHSRTMDLLLKAVKYCLQSSIWLLMYPKYLHNILRHISILSEREIFQISTPLCSIQNDLLDLIINCHQVLLQHSPDLHDLSIDHPEEIMINKKLLVNLQPIYHVGIKVPENFLLEKERECLENVNITFNLLTPFVNFCTAVISKMGRPPSRSRLSLSSTYSGNFASMWESSLNKRRVGTALEICLNLLLCQSILVLLKPNIKQIEKNRLRKFISCELVSFVRLASTYPNFPDVEPAVKSSVERMSARTNSSEHLLEMKSNSSPASSLRTVEMLSAGPSASSLKTVEMLSADPSASSLRTVEMLSADPSASSLSTVEMLSADPPAISLSTVEMLSAGSRMPSSVELRSLVPSAETLLEKLSTTSLIEKRASKLTFFTKKMDISEESETEDFDDFNTLKKEVEEIPVQVLLPARPLEEFGYSSSSSSSSSSEEEEQILGEQKADNDDNAQKDEVEESSLDLTDVESLTELRRDYSQSSTCLPDFPSETVFGRECENLTKFLCFMAFFFEHLFHMRYGEKRMLK